MAAVIVGGSAAAAELEGLAQVVGTIATAAAAYVDNAFIIPGLLGGGDPVAPKLHEIPLQTADEGSPRNFGFGRFLLVPAHVLWLVKDEEIVQVTGGKAGRKGGGNTKFVSADMALALNNAYSGKLLRLLADAELLYANPRNIVVLVDHRMSVSEVSSRMRVTADADGPDFSRFFAVDDVLLVEGFDDADANGLWKLAILGDGSMDLDPLDAQTTAGLSGGAGTKENPGKITRIDDSLVSRDMGVVAPVIRRGPSAQAVSLLADGTKHDFTELFKTGDEVSLTGLEPENKDVQDGSVAISVTSSPQRFTIASGSWTNLPAVGQQLQTSGFSNPTNNGFFTVTARTSTTIDVFETTAAEGSGTGKVIEAQPTVGGRYKIATAAPPHSLASPLLGWSNISDLSLEPLQNQVHLSVDHVAPASGAYPRVKNDNPRLWSPPDILDDLTYHQGTVGQNPDPLIESHEGLGEVPGYRDEAYVVLEGLNLTDFGNRPPEIRAVLERYAPETIATALNFIFHRAGFTAFQFHQDLFEVPLLGHNIRGPQTVVQAISPVLIAYDLLAQERADHLFFFPRRKADTVEVDVDDLASRDWFEPPPEEPMSVQTAPEGKLPSEVTIHYIDALTFEKGSQFYKMRAPSGPDRQVVQQVNLEDEVLYPFHAKDRVTEMFLQQHRNGTTIELSLPPSYAHLLENDLVKVPNPADGQTYTARVVEIERGANYALRVRAVVEDVDTAVAGSLTSGSQPPPPIVFPPAELHAEFLDIPPVSNLQIRDPGIYFAAASRPGGRWRGCRVYQSEDNGQSYQQIGAIQFEHTMGHAVDVLGDGPTGVWDESNKVTIELDAGDLSSTTREWVKRGRNWAVLGDEIIGFSTVTVNSDGSLALTDLLRGLRNTEDETGSHQDGDRFVLITAFGTSGIFVEHAQGYSAVGRPRLYKFLPAGELLDNVPAVSHTLLCANVRPFSPHNAKKTLDGSNNATFTWDRRTRALMSTFGPGPGQLIEEFEAYDLEILNGSGQVVWTFHLTALGTGSPTITRSHTYPAIGEVSQTAHGLTPGDPIRVKFYQVGAVGRSKPLDVTL